MRTVKKLKITQQEDIMKIEKTVWNRKSAYSLKNGLMEVIVNPQDGMNIYDITYRGRQLTSWNEEKYQNRATYAIPVLYPTPNRSDGLKIRVGEEQYDARMHGLIRLLPFEVTKMECTEASVLLTGSLKWDENQADFAMFPFPSTLHITVEVKENEVIWSYEVENQGERELPYGIAIHPYFSKRGQNVTITVPADSVMEMTEEKIPTGKVIPVGETVPDLRQPTAVAELNLDHVFTDCHKGECAVITYDDCTISLKASEEFGHIVVFTPEAPFFCIENQSCSTDCFNLYAKGFEKESGLLTVKPGEKRGGAIQFICAER